MAYTAPATWTTGQIVTAANLNEQLRDNFIAVAGTDGKVDFAIVDATAWRLGYFGASGASAQLALGTKGYVLVANGSTAAPSFSSIAADLDVHRVANY